MTGRVRLGAVNYLNVRPLVFGLDRRPDVALRFDSPAECARLLASGQIDLGMIPSIAYLDRPADGIVPDVCIGSEGPVASVAIFTRKPMREVRSIALDTSSRTSAMLVRIFCATRFEVSPAFRPHPPDLGAMLAVADAALLIGDIALFSDARAFGADKLDLGDAWTTMTGLPFVWAFWAGPVTPAAARIAGVLATAAGEGMARSDAIAADYCARHPARIPIARAYLARHLAFHLSPKAIAGLRTFYREATRLDPSLTAPELRFLTPSATANNQ